MPDQKPTVGQTPTFKPKNPHAALYISGAVTRYHTLPFMARFQQTNAAHQWGCAALLIALHPDVSTNLLKTALVHDAGELFVGDTPAPAKRHYGDRYADVEAQARKWMVPSLDPISAEDVAWLNFVDVLERALFVKLFAPERLEAVVDMDALRRAAQELGCYTAAFEILNSIK